jgi:hypothetical protein
MPWRDATPMNERTQFIADHLRDVLSIVDMCNLCPRTLLLPMSPTLQVMDGGRFDDRS